MPYLKGNSRSRLRQDKEALKLWIVNSLTTCYLQVWGTFWKLMRTYSWTMNNETCKILWQAKKLCWNQNIVSLFTSLHFDNCFLRLRTGSVRKMAQNSPADVVFVSFSPIFLLAYIDWKRNGYAIVCCNFRCYLSRLKVRNKNS